MHFSTFLAGVLLALSANALPTPTPEPKSGLITLPLRRLEQRSSAHPLIAHQQNINRSHRRYARMTGRREPSTEELHENLRKRVLSVEGEEGLQRRYNRFVPPKGRAVGEEGDLERRYNRFGVPKSTKTKKAGSGAVLASSVAAQAKAKTNQTKSKNDKDKGHRGGNGHGKGVGAAGAGADADAGADAGASANNGTDTGANTGASDTASTTVADTVTVANAPTAANSLGLDIEANDIGYLATVQIGTPAQDFSILMDSGSADLWVGAENCQSEDGGDCGNHKFLGPQGSSSFVNTNQPFQVTYGTGAVSGDIVTDNIVLAGLALNAHKFGVATTESVEFSDDTTPFDGLMGLAQSTLSQQQTLTPIEALADQGLVADAITSYKISRLADNKNDGEITFGGLDETKFDPATLVTLDNVSQQGFWEGDMDAITVDGQDSGLQGRTAILDTGTTLIIAPPDDAAAVHSLIDGAQDAGQGLFTVPCTTTASIALSFGGSSFAIDPRDIAFQPVDPADPTGDCISGISAGQIGGATEWLVGDVFLKNAYFSTDVTKNTVSLAKLV